MTLGGIWLPIVTPFLNGEVDYDSYGKLIEHYLGQGISGLIPMGTTGESPVITDKEYEGILDATVAAVAGRVQVYPGLGGNHTDSILRKVKVAEKYGIGGILSVCPYYSRPGQEGLTRHFMAVSEATDLNIVIYNIPYRTGVNMTNDTLFRLAEQENIRGVKDACGDIRQSLDLLNQKPDGFSVLTGEDLLLFTTLAHGGEGGILAAAHLHTDRFVVIHRLMAANDQQGALEIWKTLQPWIPLLFAEPNPVPLKYVLARMGRIASPEVRLPLTGVSPVLQGRLDPLAGEIGQSAEK